MDWRDLSVIIYISLRQFLMLPRTTHHQLSTQTSESDSWRHSVFCTGQKWMAHGISAWEVEAEKRSNLEHVVISKAKGHHFKVSVRRFKGDLTTMLFT